MKPTIEEVEARLLESIRLQRADGYQIKSGEWGVALDDSGETGVWVVDEGGGDNTDCLCPMAALIVGREEDPEDGVQTGDPELACALELGCTSQEVCNFVVGFDGAELLSPDWKDDEYYQLGKKLRQHIEGGQ